MYTIDTKITVTVAKIRDTYMAYYRVGALDTDIQKSVNETVFYSLISKGATLTEWSDPLPKTA